MHTRYGPLLRWLFRRFFEPVHFPEEAQVELEELARKGTLVYVMRSAGILNFLYFNWAYARRGLPLASSVLGLSTWLVRPFAALFRRRPTPPCEDVVEAVAHGEAAMVFLRRPAVLQAHGAATDDPFAGLVALQRKQQRPIYVVPQLLIFKRAPVRLRPGVADTVLGSAEVPGRIHAFVSFLFNHRRSFVKIGKPIDLRAVLELDAAATDERIARKVRGALAVGLARELRAVVGPPLKDASRLVEETLRDRILRAELSEVAAERRISEVQVIEEARRALHEISARYSPAWIDGANAVARWVFHRIYDGINVDEEGLRRAAEASKKAPLVICPTHRSHVDYLLVSHVLLERGIMPPLVAAGANLSFFPIGPIFRRGGAFFIRRSFKGDKVYGASLSAYVRKIARDGYTQEFYPEGGRTRTGRILQPKYGLIGMEIDAWIAGARDDLHFVPVAIDYAKLIEARSYAREMAGGEKKKEDIKGLLKAPAVLRSRWGQVHLQVDTPISLAAFAASRGFDPHRHSEEEKRDLVRALAHRIAYGMGRVQTITSTALAAAALLGHHRRSCSSRELAARIELMRRLARARGARFSRLVNESPSDPQAPGAMHEAIAGFAGDKQVSVRQVDGETFYQVQEDARSFLAFYKNNILHHFEEEAILAAALLSFPGNAAPMAELLPRVEFLSRLLKRELSYRALPLEQIVHRTVELLDGMGLVEGREHEEVRALPEALEDLGFLRNLLGDVIESYQVAVGSLDVLEAGPLERKELVRKSLEHGRRVYLAGRVQCAEAISRPTFEKAISWMQDEGYLNGADEKRLELGERFASQEERASFGREIGRFLAPPPT
ncbi:1-acyl-sn-glycerol-3-phosphate acyltransferase [Vulgatibacter sp.]|uniref:1-acyl-sn-glycerol-3-phosphate acyltransferase n=1 Tax=Vulgatibacter sp. TaxID=1971226 RepID=UPI003564B4AD